MNIVSKILLATTALAAISACSSEMSEEEQAIYDERKAKEAAAPKNMMAVIQHNPDLSTAGMAVGLSGVAEDLGQEGPFTAFVGTNEAFNKLGVDELNALLQPEKKEELANILKYNVMIANMDSAAITKAIGEGGGTASLKTAQGGSLKAMMNGGKIVLEDAKGNRSTITQADVKADNGIVHIVDTVLIP
ncbi:fasciclin domain-containing protein [Parasphingorhabdus sp.]|uniref:fasciclin domain-containing protein n=1 Tax=Parasphingorhabdus sp. TaxID=2709688 RepID=UPI003C71C91E